MAVEHGANALGLVSEMPSGPGVIPEELIADIAASVPKSVATFLLTSKRKPEEIVNQVRRCGTNTVQLCDSIEGTLEELRSALPDIRIVQVVHVREESSVDEAVAASRSVDFVLLDSGNPALEVKELGGTGRTHDWSLSRRIVDLAQCPVYLAGGLNPLNVASAIDAVRPYGIDLCSGVRTEGALDGSKLSDFFANI